MPSSSKTSVSIGPASGRGIARPVGDRDDVVILDERSLDCDLATAIDRVRNDDETRRRRILIIGPEEEPGGDSVPEVGDLPDHWSGPVVASRREAAKALAEALLPLLGCQDRFYAEMRDTLESLDRAMHEESRARLKNRARVVGEILDWCQAVQDDLQVVARRTRSGQQQLDLLDLWQEVAREFERHHSVPVTVAGTGPCPFWGDYGAVREACWWILGLTSQRIGGVGSILVEVGWRRPHVSFRVLGNGEPREVQGPLPARIRALLVDLHGASIRPDSLGPNGAGVAVQIPCEPEPEADHARVGDDEGVFAPT